MKMRAWQKFSVYVLAILFSVVAALPFLWVIITSLKTDRQIYDTSQIIPSFITFQNYIHVLSGTPFLLYFWNSSKISLITTVISIVLAVMAAYGFCRYKVLFASTTKLMVLFTRMFPGILMSIPYFVIMRKMNLMNTHTGLIIIYCSFALPFAIWNLCAQFEQFPWELEEAAFIDGASRPMAFLKIVFPVAKPSILATSLFCFLMSWDEYMYAYTYITSTTKLTVQIGIQSFIGEYSTQWGSMSAAVVLSLVPVTIFFMVVQKNLVGGLAAGAIKG